MSVSPTDAKPSSYEVRAGVDHLETFSKKPLLDAVAELVWNGLDAESGLVRVELDTASLGDGAAVYVSSVRVVDDGHGIEYSRASESFASLGDSWKKTLNGRTKNGLRVLHGQRGRGRFYAYSLGDRVKWTTVYHDEPAASRRGYEISGSQLQINRFEVSVQRKTEQPTGTSVEVHVPQTKNLSSLLRSEFAQRLGARLAPYLLGNPDVEVRYRGKRLDPAELMATAPVDQPLDQLREQDLKGHGTPLLRIVEWVDDVGKTQPLLALCNASGATLIESRETQKHAVKVTGYLMWDGFGEPTTDLLLAFSENPALIDAAQTAIETYISDRESDLELQIVAKLKGEGSYPKKYDVVTTSPLEIAERDLYNHLLVVARSALGGSTRSRRLSADLMRLAIEERPAALQVILEQALALKPETHEEIADLLTRSPLPEIVRAANVVTRRIDLLVGLKALLYDTDDAKRLREVDQLHPLVAANEWLFGEEWKLAHSEASLTTVLRHVVADTTVLEAELLGSGGRVLRSDGRQGRVDLLLQRHFQSPTGAPERLVVELKRPSKKLDAGDVEQVKSYARALSKHQGVDQGKWHFWLVGSEVDADVLEDAKQTDRAWGHLVRNDAYDVFVMPWGRLIDGAMRRLSVFKDELSYDVTQLDAVKLLSRRYEHLNLSGTTEGLSEEE